MTFLLQCLREARALSGDLDLVPPQTTVDSVHGRRAADGAAERAVQEFHRDAPAQVVREPSAFHAVLPSQPFINVTSQK